MPFASKAQARKCFAMKARGQAKGWDCEEWAEETDFEELPEKKRKKESAARLLQSYIKYRQLRKKAALQKSANRLALLRPLRKLLPTVQRFLSKDPAMLAKAIQRRPSTVLWSNLAFNPVSSYFLGEFGGRGLANVLGWDPETAGNIGGMAGMLGSSFLNPFFNPLARNRMLRAAKMLENKQLLQTIAKTDPARAKLLQAIPNLMRASAYTVGPATGGLLLGGAISPWLPEEWQGWASPLLMMGLPAAGALGGLGRLRAVQALRAASAARRAAPKTRIAGLLPSPEAVARRAAGLPPSPAATTAAGLPIPAAAATTAAGQAANNLWWLPASRRLAKITSWPWTGAGFAATIASPLALEAGKLKGQAELIKQQDEIAKQMGFQGIQEAFSMAPHIAPIMQSLNQMPPETRQQLLSNLPAIAPMLQQFASLPPAQQQAILNQLAGGGAGGAGILGWLSSMFGA